MGMSTSLAGRGSTGTISVKQRIVTSNTSDPITRSAPDRPRQPLGLSSSSSPPTVEYWR